MKALSLFVAAILVSYAFIYMGGPIHIGATPKFPSFDFQRQLPGIRDFFAHVADAVDFVGLPKGRIASVPVITVKSELGVFDAAWNIFASFCFGVVVSITFFVGGIIGVVYGWQHASWSEALLGVAIALLMPPLLLALGVAVVSTAFLFEESTFAYFFVFTPLFLLGWGIAILLTLSLVSLGLNLLGLIIPPNVESIGGAGHALPSNFRIHPRTGVFQRRGLLGWTDTLFRKDPRTGIIQVLGLFGWRNK